MTGFNGKRQAVLDKLVELTEEMGLYEKQRPWIGLTLEESLSIIDNCRTPANLIEMVEAKLKEKNHGSR